MKEDLVKIVARPNKDKRTKMKKVKVSAGAKSSNQQRKKRKPSFLVEIFLVITLIIFGYILYLFGQMMWTIRLEGFYPQSFQTGGQVVDTFDEEERQLDQFLSQVKEKTCQTCFKKERCWVQNFSKTYDSMQKLMDETERNGTIKDKMLQSEWKKYCIRPDRVIDTIKQEHSLFIVNQKLRKQVMESQKLVADQLLGVSRVMGEFLTKMWNKWRIRKKKD